MAKQRSEAPPFRERVYTTLYRLRYGWQFRSSVEISTVTPLWLLGAYYHEGTDDGEKKRNVEGAPPHVRAFMEHFYSIPWMTYRSNFPAIADTNLTTDCGWGCMVRSGQMVLATALNRHVLGREWRLPTSTEENRGKHAKVMSWFADCLSSNCPFSLHALMDQAVRHDNNPGDWFGPSQVAILIRECIKIARTTIPELQDVQAYVAHDCTVYVSDVLEIFKTDPEQALVLLVPVRLGSEVLNPIYIPCIQGLLTLDYCVGIIGGRPKHSVYFVGFQDDKLIHLDPHYCQSAQIMEDGDDPYQLDFKSYHCTTPRKIAANKMDPSCTIGFYCQGLAEFHLLREVAEKVLAPPKQKGVYPFFTFTDTSIGETINTTVDMQVGFVSGNDLLLHGEQFEGLDFHSLSDDEEFVVVDCKGSQRSFSDPVISSNTRGILHETTGKSAGSDKAQRASSVLSAPDVTDELLTKATETLLNTDGDSFELLANTPDTLVDTNVEALPETLPVADGDTTETLSDTTETLSNTTETLSNTNGDTIATDNN